MSDAPKRTMPCPECGDTMEKVRHSAEPIADAVCETFRCDCGHHEVVMTNVFSDEWEAHIQDCREYYD